MTAEKSGEFRGKSVEAATNAGLAALRLSLEEVTVEIVRPGSRGVLGIGAEDAVVRVTAIGANKTAPAPTAKPEVEPTAVSRPTPAPAARAPSRALRPPPHPSLPNRQPPPSVSISTRSTRKTWLPRRRAASCFWACWSA